MLNYTRRSSKIVPHLTGDAVLVSSGRQEPMHLRSSDGTWAVHFMPLREASVTKKISLAVEVIPNCRLDGASGNGSGNGQRHKRTSGVATLMYLVRLRKSPQPEAIVERLKALANRRGSRLSPNEMVDEMPRSVPRLSATAIVQLIRSRITCQSIVEIAIDGTSWFVIS